ncbi:hypothetical protein KTO58_19880 [Chitinophaga pendula]|uniref:hypothetical protein n=1 Tax=Chitinophaga TaxID=79328 RepID=UPI000BB0B70E|nr:MULTISPECIES: hypothetical protein [Chitinophaga]ASZ11071.1 hypothetical protein CK934_08915 [Chitinophaga sp. MD30]UCJ05931.1 hypothetical protein KTO58_19880 [Chitinophaga pendula]
MDYFNNILCLNHSELVGGIISADNYDSLVRRQKIEIVRRGCYGTPALISYNSLPERLKKAVCEKYGDPYAGAVASPFKSAWIYDGAAFNFFDSYRLPNGKRLPEDKINEYTATACALNTINRVLTMRKAIRNTRGGSTANLLATIIPTARALQGEYGYVLPASDRRLRQKLTDYKKEGYISLVSKKFCNENRAVTIENEQESLLRVLLTDHRNLNSQQVADLYNIVAQPKGWKCITRYLVAERRTEWDLDTFAGRRGSTAFDNTKAMQVKRKGPSAPMLFWTLDGWDVELLYQKTEVDKNGKSVTTYHNRLTLVLVMDAYNKYPIGYAIGDYEKPDLIREAVRNAINHTIDLFGSRYKPDQLQSDRYQIKNLQPFFSGATKTYTPTRVKNAKGKVIEKHFDHLNETYFQLFPNWSGHNVDAAKKSQPNEEYLNKIRHSFPDRQTCLNDIRRVIAIERQKKHVQYMQGWNNTPADRKHLLTDEQYLYHLCESTERTSKFTPAGLIKTVDGVSHTYDTFDETFRNYTHIDWIVKYDPADHKRVLVHNADGTLRYLLDEKYIQPMALADREEGDAEELQRITSFNKKMKAGIIENMANDNRVVENMFNETPSLNETLTKLMIVDSAGQHKDRKNANRIATSAQKRLQQQEKKSTELQIKSIEQQHMEYLESKVDYSKYLNQ